VDNDRGERRNKPDRKCPAHTLTDAKPRCRHSRVVHYLRSAPVHGMMTIHVEEEAHHAWLPLDALLQMASAPEAVKARLLQVDFQLDRSKLQAVRDFASRLGPR
jgi:hypothetical protein